MRAALIVGVLLLNVIATPTTYATGVLHPLQQSAVVEFTKTTSVAGVLLNAGRYVVVHDEEKMARGEPCTTISFLEPGDLYVAAYGVEPSADSLTPMAVSFMCIPHSRPTVSETKLTLKEEPGNTYGCTYSWGWMMNKLTEYQFAGDAEGHGVPDSTPELVEPPMIRLPRLTQ